ncbi:hypothetical protein C1M59_21575 [Vibrio diazotrophicus]|nr:hypothetical protein C1M59_21575 [Vibrio diazotrophicus]
MKNMDDFKYKGFHGTVVKANNGFSGHVKELKGKSIYFGSDLSELENQFKVRVECFIHACEQANVEPLSLVNYSPYKVSKIGLISLFLLAVALMGGVILLYINKVPVQYSKLPPFVVNSGDWYSGMGAFLNDFSTPILSLLSFIALLWTIYQQIVSHKLSLEELRYTREELASSTEANQQQAIALKQQVEETEKATVTQKFENTFYALLEQHNKTLEVAVRTVPKEYMDKFDVDNHTYLTSGYKSIHENAELCTYFRVLYQLLKFIATSFEKDPLRVNTLTIQSFEKSLNDGEKFYSSLVRSFVPTKIIKLLAINCYLRNGRRDDYFLYHQLIERYAFLEHYVFDKKYAHELYCVLGSYTRSALGENKFLRDYERQFLASTHSPYRIIDKSNGMERNVNASEINDQDYWISVIAVHFAGFQSIKNVKISKKSMMYAILSKKFDNLDLSFLQRNIRSEF